MDIGFANMTRKTQIKMRALLLTTALLAALVGIMSILDMFSHPGAAAQARRAALAHRATSAPPAPASLRHWHRAWTCPVGASLTEAPAPWSNGWVAATEKGGVVALDNGGRLQWFHAFSNARFVGSPVVAGTNVVVLGHDGAVMALDIASGKLMWRGKVEGVCRHGPICPGNAGLVVLLSAENGVLHGLDAQDGHERWQSEPTNRSDGPPGSDGQILAYGNCDSAVHIFRMTDGRRLAKIPVGDDAQMAGGVLVRDGRVYGGTRSGALVCVDASSNRISWQFQVAGSEAFNTPVAVRDLVFMGSRDGNVTACAAWTGAARWQVSLSNAVKTLCVVDDAVFTVAGGSLVGLRATDGGMFMKLAVGDDVDGPVWNGRILVVAADGGNITGFRGE